MANMWTVVEMMQMKTPLGSDGRGLRTGLRRMTAALLLGTALIGVPVGAVLTFDRSDPISSIIVFVGHAVSEADHGSDDMSGGNV